MTEKEAIIILNMIGNIGYSRYNSLLASFGSAAAALSASESRLANVGNVGTVIAEKIKNWESSTDLQKELEMVRRAGVKIITLIDEDYPCQLKEIQDRPLCLYVRGNLDADINKSIAIVGTRKITSYGREVCENLASALAYAGWTIISGLAMGVDGIAHESAVCASGKTIGVLGGGLMRFHPQEHVELARKMTEIGGAVISEFPMLYSPTRRSFPMRNRIISGLSRGVLVIEAGVQSGALITVDFALEQNRLVFAVPGRINAPSSQGCNRLIKNGAKLIENIDDIFDEFEFLPNFNSGFAGSIGTGGEPEKTKKELELTDEEQKIVEVLQLEDKGVDRIITETGLPVGKALALLQSLCMKKVIEEQPGKIFAVKKDSGMKRDKSK